MINCIVTSMIRKITRMVIGIVTIFTWVVRIITIWWITRIWPSKIQTEKIPRKIKPRVCLPLISRLLIWINSRYLQLVMWPHLPGIGRLLSGTYLRRNSLIWNEAHFLSILARVCHDCLYLVKGRIILFYRPSRHYYWFCGRIFTPEGRACSRI